jgi:hypothetical protein
MDYAPLSDEQVLARLWRIVERERVPVLPRTSQMWCAGNHPHYGKAAVGMYSPATGYIYLRPDYMRNPWVLAHELGHRILCREGKTKHAEAEADAAGRGLLIAELTRDEVLALLPRLDGILPGLTR